MQSTCQPFYLENFYETGSSSIQDSTLIIQICLTEVLRLERKLLLDYPLEFISNFKMSTDMPIFCICVLPPSIDELRSRLSERLERYEAALRDIQKLKDPELRKHIDRFIFNVLIEQAVLLLKEILINNKS